jgi:hypothetical protein
MIHAFHGPAAFAYDAWEQGFARAAASVIARDPSLGLPDASANNLYSLLKFYDLLNQPALGNPTFFPPSQANLQLEGTFGIAKMLIPRMGMSGAAWLKVYIENQAFFRQFHEAYYAQFDPNAPVKLSGNVPALRAIAASIVPQVENVPFPSWFERQFVLDSSVALGNKLYAFVVPSEVSQENGQSAAVVLVHFATQPDGDERLLNGRAYATYFDGTGARVNLGIQSEQTPLAEGEGFLTTLAFPTPGFDAGRITMDFHAGNETARTFLPSGFRGDFQGVVLGATAGSVRVLQRTLPPVQERGNGDSIDNGGFGVTLGTGPNELGVTEVTVTNADGNTVTTHRFNTGDGQYYAVVRVAGDVKTLKRTFRVQPGGVPVLVSFPLRPLQTDAAAALGLSPTDFLLSYWDPIRPGYQTFTVGQVGGATAPLQIGRGYWLKVAPSTGALQVEATLTGYEPAPGADVTVSLPYGWNLVGTPFEAGTEVRGLLVQYLQNDVRSWDQAVTDNLVASTIYGFDPAVGYVPLTSANNGRLEQWQGYWLRVLVPGGITLVLPGSDSAGRAATARAAGLRRPATRHVKHSPAATFPCSTERQCFATIEIRAGGGVGVDRRRRGGGGTRRRLRRGRGGRQPRRRERARGRRGARLGAGRCRRGQRPRRDRRGVRVHRRQRRVHAPGRGGRREYRGHHRAGPGAANGRLFAADRAGQQRAVRAGHQHRPDPRPRASARAASSRPWGRSSPWCDRRQHHDRRGRPLPDRQRARRPDRADGGAGHGGGPCDRHRRERRRRHRRPRARRRPEPEPAGHPVHDRRADHPQRRRCPGRHHRPTRAQRRRDRAVRHGRPGELRFLRAGRRLHRARFEGRLRRRVRPGQRQ